MLVRAFVLASVAACSTRPATKAPAGDGAPGEPGGTSGSGAAGTYGSDGGGNGGGGSDGAGATDGSAPGDTSIDHGAGDAIRDDASMDRAGDTALPDDGSVDHVGDGPMAADAAVCETISAAYEAAVHAAQECSLGADNQCTVQVSAGFVCQCTTFANGSADALEAIATQYLAAGCRAYCNGSCAQLKAHSCLADTTSSTGGRCKTPGVLTLQAASSGGTFSVPAGEEIDITLESVALGSYSTSVMLSSSDLATVLEVTIPAGPPEQSGPTHLYRVRVLSAGQVQIQIPFESGGAGSSVPPYTVTISAH